VWSKYCNALERDFDSARVLDVLAEAKREILTFRNEVYTSETATKTVAVQNRDLWTIHEFIAQQSLQAEHLGSLVHMLSDEIVRLKGEVSKQKAVIYRGVHTPGEVYDTGDMVTCGGSLWHCNEITEEKPGEGSSAWTLAVKRGRDGKDLTRGAA